MCCLNCWPAFTNPWREKLTQCSFCLSWMPVFIPNTHDLLFRLLQVLVKIWPSQQNISHLIFNTESYQNLHPYHTHVHKHAHAHIYTIFPMPLVLYFVDHMKNFVFYSFIYFLSSPFLPPTSTRLFSYFFYSVFLRLGRVPDIQ